MKKLFLILLVLASIPSAHAYTTRKSSTTVNQARTNADSIELIDGTPKRKFQKLQPIWVTAYTMNGAIKKAKKDAAKAGADAIIEVTTGENKTSVGSVAATGVLFGMATSQSLPVIKGWAVKWLD